MTLPIIAPDRLDQLVALVDAAGQADLAAVDELADLPPAERALAIRVADLRRQQAARDAAVVERQRREADVLPPPVRGQARIARGFDPENVPVVENDVLPEPRGLARIGAALAAGRG
jgi:hypothetical protein